MNNTIITVLSHTQKKLCKKTFWKVLTMKPHHAIFISSQRGRNVHTKEGGEEVKMNLIEVTDKVTGMITTVNVNNMNTVIKSGDNAMFVFGNYSLTTEESYEEIKSFLEQMC